MTYKKGKIKIFKPNEVADAMPDGLRPGAKAGNPLIDDNPNIITLPQVYTRRDFKKIPKEIAELLDSLKDYGYMRPLDPLRPTIDHTGLARIVQENDPFSIILFGEHLSPEHYKRKGFMKITKKQIFSEIEDIIFECCSVELNSAMREFIDKKPTEQEEREHLKKLVKSYYPKARRILKARYQEFHPRSWEKKLKERKYLEPRITFEAERIFNLPFPLDYGKTITPQQFYFLGKTRQFTAGRSSGSGTRQIHSFYGAAFMEAGKQIEIPTYILVYDKHNELKYITTSEEFAIMPYSLGSNCDIPYKTMESLEKRTINAKYCFKADLSIKSITLEK